MEGVAYAWPVTSNTWKIDKYTFGWHGGGGSHTTCSCRRDLGHNDCGNGWLWTAESLQCVPSGLTTVRTDLPRPRWVNKLQPQQLWRWLPWYTHGPWVKHMQDRQARARVTQGGGPDTTCPCQWGGKEWPQQVHVFEFCRLFSSLREVSARPTRCVGFENPTSAPLIVPVVTITPLPIQTHVRTFYIARYTSCTIYIQLHNKIGASKEQLQKEGKRKNQKNRNFTT